MLAAFPMTQAQTGEPAATEATATQSEAKPYAQELVDRTLERHPDLLDVELHAVRPGATESTIVAGKRPARIGRKTRASEIEVARTGVGFVEINKTGDANVEVQIPLLDAAGRTLGSVEVKFAYPTGSGLNTDQLRKAAEIVRDELAQQIPQLASLFEPADKVAAPRPAAAGPTITKAVEEEESRSALGNKQSLPMTKEVASGAALGQTQEGYSDAIKNQAGVQATNSAGSSNDAFAVRGIKLNLFSNYRLDGGLPVTGVITNPTENKARVETLKGANALMFGVASPAGIINFVNKRAGERDVTSAGLAGNLFGQYGASVDIGRRFGPDKQVGVRFNASGTHLENGVRDLSGEGYFASVGVDLRATSRLTLQGDIEHYKRNVPEQAGIGLLPAVNGVVPITRVPEPRNLLSGTWNLYTPRTTNVQLRADYALTDSWKVLAQAGQSQSHRHRNTVRIRNYDPDTGANGTVAVQPVTHDYRNTFARTELLGKFTTWGISHDLTVGLSTSERFSVAYDVQNITLPQKQNIFDPIVLDPPVFAQPGRRNPEQTSTDTGLYTYDTIGITPKLKLLLGVRRVQDKEVNGPVSTTSYVTSPAYGVMYDILPTTTLFASYMEGLEAGATAPANVVNANEILAPQVSKQKEIGIRDSYFKGLSTSASYFDIRRGNAVTDPSDNVFKYLGDLSYRGFEATISYDLTRDLKLNAAVLRLNARQDSPTQPLIDGKVPENTPKWNANFGVSYKVPAIAGLTVRAGAKFIDKRPVNPENQGYIPGYTLYDAGLSYATRIAGRRASFGLSIDNLANKRYWNSVQTGTYGIGMDRSIKFNAKFDF
jgi:iron complex outermembrane receptor protein